MGLKSIFISQKKQKVASGLFASLDDLVAMRKNIVYMRNYQRKYAYGVQSGAIQSAFKGRGMELAEVRAYNFGDDVRDMDWRVSARKDAPYTKVFVEERDVEVLVYLDLSANMVFGSRKELKSVLAAKLCALIGWLALENKDRFGCVVFDGVNSYWFKPQNNRAQLMAVLHKIAAVTVDILKKTKFEEKAFVQSLKLLEQNASNKARIFFIGDYSQDFKLLKLELAVLAKRNKLYMMRVYDKLEEIAPAAGEYMAQFEDKKFVFEVGGKVYAKNYARYFKDKLKNLDKFKRQNNCELLEFCVGDNLLTNLLKH